MPSLKELYLIAYNVACAAGWAYVFYLTASALQRGEDAGALWRSVREPLTLVQSAAALEVVHALLGLVSSPVFTVALQVSSRLILVWCYTRAFAASQQHWSLYLMVASWALSEVPRYLFYVCAQLKSQPYPLFWLRYSLFLVLYPTGISGELLQVYASLSDAACSPVCQRASLCLFAVYVVGSPYMILNMWGNRVRALKKRATDAKPQAPPDGLCWPVTDAATQERGSMPTNKAIWAAAVGAASAQAQAAVERERNWRFGYAHHAEENVKLSLASPADALAIARAGLAAAHARFRFRRAGAELPLGEAIAAAPKDAFLTFEVAGAGARPASALQVPYGGSDPARPYYLHKGSKAVLEGKALCQQLDAWAAYGTIERSAAESIKALALSGTLDLSDRYFVLLGATSAMGPLDLLLKYGANIVAVDLDRPGVWEKILAKARASPGRVIFPVSAAKAGARRALADYAGDDRALAAVAGANLLGATPELVHWLAGVCPGKALTIGNYTYLDGPLHVQLSIGCDAIMAAVCAARKDTALAFLCTPTDLHVIPAEAAAAASANAAAYPAWLRALAALGTRALRPNALPPVKAKGGDIYYVDGLSVAQGPNYALAKRLQHWRAVVARSEGHTVSSNIAPSTATESVTSNATFQMAYGGFHVFKPLEVMYQETSNAVMMALLVSDLRDKKSHANPATKLANPYQLFEYNSFHGGVWRCGYRLDTIGEVAVLYYLLANYGTYIGAGVAALASVVAWVLTGRVGPL